MTVQEMVADALAAENVELREELRLARAERDGYRLALLSALDRITLIEKTHAVRAVYASRTVQRAVK